MSENNREDFERIWESIIGRDREGSEARRRAFLEVFEAGGATKNELQQHVSRVCSSLCGRPYTDTLVALLRGLGYNELEILSFIRDEFIRRKWPVSQAWATIRAANLSTDAQAVVEALKKIDDSRTWTDDSFEDVPF